jgi:cytochrome c-type biogenesis protein CcmH/NrfF
MLTELRDLTVDYAKQETLEPLKSLGKFLLWGVMGSLLIGLGFLLWVLAALRAMQTETGTHFTNNLSWIPYVVTLVACAIVTALSAYAIKKDYRAAQKRKAEREAEVVTP